MPEGDTVWLAGRRMHAALAGEVLAASDFRVPQYATRDLSGRRVLEVVSRGKHLLTRMDGDLTLHTHFRMDGTWHLYPRGRPWTGGPQWQVRVVLETAERVAVGYRLPVIDLVPSSAEASLVGHLGPDVLGDDWYEAEAVRRVRGEPAREIGLALLDQRNLAGVGNLYMTETCFLSGVTPWTPVAEVPVERLVDRARGLLRLNRDVPAQVTTGDARRGRTHWVFEQSRCLRCGTRVATARLGTPPHQRIGYWCPRCQPGPAPAPVAVRELLGPRTPGRTRYRP